MSRGAHECYPGPREVEPGPFSQENEIRGVKTRLPCYFSARVTVSTWLRQDWVEPGRSLRDNGINR